MCPPERIKGLPKPQRDKLNMLLGRGKYNSNRSETQIRQKPDTLRPSWRYVNVHDTYADVLIDHTPGTVYISD